MGTDGIPRRITKISPMDDLPGRMYRVSGNGVAQAIVHENQCLSVYNKNTNRIQTLPVLDINPRIHLGYSLAWSPQNPIPFPFSSPYLCGIRMECDDPVMRINAHLKWKEQVRKLMDAENCTFTDIPQTFEFPPQYRLCNREALHQFLAGIADSKSGVLISKEHYIDLLSLCSLLGIDHSGSTNLGSFQAHAGVTYLIENYMVNIDPKHVYSVEKGRGWIDGTFSPVTKNMCTFPIQIEEETSFGVQPVHIQIEPPGCVLSHTGTAISLAWR